MRYWLLTVSIFITSLLHAQFGFYAEGGGNYSIIRATRTPGIIDGKGGFGFQAGGGVEYHFQNDFFMYMGAQFASEHFKKDSSAKVAGDDAAKFNYNPLFVNIPFGFGYQFPITKELGFRVYAGINTQIGVGGTLKHEATYAIPGTEGSRVVSDTHRMHYGRSINVQSEFQSDLNNTIWGVNIGAGLNLNKNVEVAIFYQEGLTNILPGGDGAAEIDKQRAVSLNLKFYFPRNYYTAVQKL